MVAAPAHETAGSLLAQIEAEQQRLRELLAAGDFARFEERPASGKWSVLENVRHLLFAEQAHLGQFVEGGRDWSSAGFTPRTMQRARKLDFEPGAPAIDEVLEAWAAVHRGIGGRLEVSDDERLRNALWTNLRHLRAHIAVIERILRSQERGKATG